MNVWVVGAELLPLQVFLKNTIISLGLGSLHHFLMQIWIQSYQESY